MSIISIHALLAESDCEARVAVNAAVISIHALLAESDRDRAHRRQLFLISIHALLAESDPMGTSSSSFVLGFLSTLSLRRATACLPACVVGASISIHALLAESDWANFSGFYWWVISIHALLAESDPTRRSPSRRRMYFYPRSPCGERPRPPPQRSYPYGYFYPRSPCGERHPRHGCQAVLKDFYPRSPCGERQRSVFRLVAVVEFLSTLSLRRATVFIKRPACGTPYFYPRSPCGERRSFPRC